ncbi:mitochondrial import inner membrane translocase subunit tim54 [Orbilia brochopaga]|uniref:Mitochondrial import inner membrane translocase subunit TIM54 n=1 Tax=Orbilia brochopaga TaxID=3140254 RepID=A0AAV9U4D1_9PEZI
MSEVPKKPNPAFEHVFLGLPKFKAKLPSKPWLVFIGLVATWTGLIVHDRREKKRAQAYWCDRISHLAQQPLPPTQLPRKVTVYLSSPPGDGITSAREYFKEYVKPVLVAAAVDYEVVEGRKTGEIRWKVAERTRRVRRGEDDTEGTEKEAAIKNSERSAGVTREEGPGGIVVVGRHTWKEYVRGLHEGWLGPADISEDHDQTEKKDALASTTPSQPVVASIDDILPAKEGEAAPQAAAVDEKSDSSSATKEEEKKKRKPAFPPPTIEQSEYPSATVPPSIPATFQPSKVIPFPHLLGFLNTPFRVQRYLTQRRLMDHVSREVAAVALGAYEPYNSREDVTDTYKVEETDWPKKWVDRLATGADEDSKDEPVREKTIVEELQVDGRIVDRMKRFVLPDDQGGAIGSPELD